MHRGRWEVSLQPSIPLIFAIILALNVGKMKSQSMAQLTIYIDDRTQEKARRAARRENRSLSSWVCEQLRLATDKGEVWPEDFGNLFGSIEDAQFDVPEELPVGSDTQRMSL